MFKSESSSSPFSPTKISGSVPPANQKRTVPRTKHPLNGPYFRELTTTTDIQLNNPLYPNSKKFLFHKSRIAEALQKSQKLVTFSMAAGHFMQTTYIQVTFSALHKGLSLLSLSIRLCISLEIEGRPPFLRNFHRQKQRKAVVCHFLTVAGCMRQTRSSHLSRDFESTIYKRRKPAVNLSRRRFFESIRCLQVASWLSTAGSLATGTALEQRIARRKVRPYYQPGCFHRKTPISSQSSPDYGQL